MTDIFKCEDLVTELVKRWPDKNVSSIPKKRLLIIDDNIEYCEMFKEAFAKYGYYETFAASNGEAGLKLFKDYQPFSVVFIDLILPGNLDGIDVFDKIRQMNPLQYVVVITGALDTNFYRRLEKFGCFTVGLKPINFVEIAEILNTNINPPVG